MRCGQNGIWKLYVEFSNSDVYERQADKEKERRGLGEGCGASGRAHPI